MLQVQQQVVTQAVRATDLCSRYIVRGVDRLSVPGVGFVLGLVPGAIKNRSSVAWDSLFPPLTEFEESQVRPVFRKVRQSSSILQERQRAKKIYNTKYSNISPLQCIERDPILFLLICD